MNSSEDRYWEELEERSWSEYIRAYRMLDESKALFATGLTRTFVATQAEAMSARTGAPILLQLLYDICFSERIEGAGPWSAADRVLDGPTSDVWLRPWRTYLTGSDPVGDEATGSEKRTAVTFETDRRVVGIRVDGERVVGIDTERPDDEDGEQESFDFDAFVLAVPAEVVQDLLVLNHPLTHEATPLRGGFNLDTAWMNGVLFYLKDRVDLPRGHVICLDSAWALTVVDQTQAWDEATAHRLVKAHGFETLLSVDVSSWDAPGDAHHVPARYQQPDDTSIRDEVWSQLRQHFPALPARTPIGVIDPGVTRGGNPVSRVAHQRGAGGGPAGTDSIGLDALTTAILDDLRASNSEPLLVNTVGAWAHRPDVDAGPTNLVVAGDYVRSGTDFASMEAANESARRAVDRLRLGQPPIPGYRHDTAVADLQGLVEPEVAWFARPRDLARRFDRHVAYPLGWRAPVRAPAVAWAVLGSAAAARALGRRIVSCVRSSRPRGQC